MSISSDFLLSLGWSLALTEVCEMLEASHPTHGSWGGWGLVSLVAIGCLRWSRCNSSSAIPASDGPCEPELRLAEIRIQMEATVCSRQRASAADFRRNMPRAHDVNSPIGGIDIQRAGMVVNMLPDHCGCTTPGPVSIWMGVRPTQPGYPSTGRQNEYWRWLQPSPGKKRWVLRNSRPCYQDCWHTDPARYLGDLGCMLA